MTLKDQENIYVKIMSVYNVIMPAFNALYSTLNAISRSHEQRSWKER